MQGVVRLFRRGVRRLISRSDIVVLRAGPERFDPSRFASQYAPVRLTSASRAAAERIADAMRSVEEDPMLIPPRLEHGDECFAWEERDRIVSFGWVTYRERTVGPTKLLDSPDRAFFYNFHTLPEYRGRGLYTLLLVHMKQTLTGEGRSDFIIDVNESNAPSFRGIRRAGFEPVGRVTHVNLLRRWRVPLAKVTLGKSGMRVFA